MKRLFVVCLILSLTLSAFAEGSLGSVDSYDVALKWIKQAYGYKEPDNIEQALEGIEEVPTEAFYRQYKTWLTGIKLIHEAGYSRMEPADITTINVRKLAEARTRFNTILDDKAFNAELKGRDLPLPGEIITYISGLMSESRGNIQDAIDAYSSVRMLFDADERLLALEQGMEDELYYTALRFMEAGDYWAAAELFGQMQDYVSPEGEFADELYAEAVAKHKAEHTFAPPTCDKPAICQVCGETQGEPLGHDWLPATPQKPETCSRCGLTRGSKLTPTPKPTAIPTPKPTPTLKPTEAPLDVGDRVTFGRFEQDGDMSNGEEDIEWVVLYTEGAAAVIISTNTLTTYVYDNKTPSNWASSAIRDYLNNEFLNSAFNSAERDSIIVKENPDIRFFYADLYQDYISGNTSYDYVWLSSHDEQTDLYFANKKKLKVLKSSNPSMYARTLGSDANIWWTRDCAASNSADECGYSPDGLLFKKGVRPTIEVKISALNRK